MGTPQLLLMRHWFLWRRVGLHLRPSFKAIGILLLCISHTLQTKVSGWFAEQLAPFTTAMTSNNQAKDHSKRAQVHNRADYSL